MRTVRFELLRPGEIVAERKRCPLVFVPVGPLEWHSLHLPVGTDALNATGVALELAGRLGGVVLPTFYWGTERERSPEVTSYLGFDRDDYVFGMNFPNHLIKSLYCREEFLALLVRELLDTLVGLEYKLIVVVNGHGALNHVATLERLCKEFTAYSPARVLLANAWAQEPFLGFTTAHAGAVETSLMMALHPESVDLNQLPPLPEPLSHQDFGIVDAETWGGDPTPDNTLRPSSDPRRHASAEVGRKFIERSVDGLEKMVRAELDALGYAE